MQKSSFYAARMFIYKINRHNFKCCIFAVSEEIILWGDKFYWDNAELIFSSLQLFGFQAPCIFFSEIDRKDICQILQFIVKDNYMCGMINSDLVTYLSRLILSKNLQSWTSCKIVFLLKILIDNCSVGRTLISSINLWDTLGEAIRQDR